MEFEQLLAEGLSLDIEAYWGAGLLPERLSAESPSWSYPAIARSILSKAQSALDMGTGEGGVLAGLAPLPRPTVAYEGWWPTIAAAQERLEPLGAHLVVPVPVPITSMNRIYGDTGRVFRSAPRPSTSS